MLMTKLVLGRGKMMAMNETEYLNTCEYGPLYENGSHYGSNFPHKYTTLIKTIGFP